MAEIGSFAVLLALALSVYSFLAGLIALIFQNPGSLPSLQLAAQPAGLPPGRAAGPAAGGNSLASLLRRSSERIG
ncbi:MAG: hypothetical protein WA623_19940, partial [Candidatus Sulfotelmatobacter sp.]